MSIRAGRCRDTTMTTDTFSRFPAWAGIPAGAAILAIAAAGESAMGRKLWGISGEPGIWSGDIYSSHNSQFLLDPYSLSHITHGVLLYGLLWLAARSSPLGLRALLAMAIESSWEVFENTDMVIQRYRAATISLHYYGDSIANSMCDILVCMAGFGLACILPTRMTVIGVIVLEIALALWIRDSLLLNIIMLVHPFALIRDWQLGKAPG
jgi:hypothetical protein